MTQTNDTIRVLIPLKLRKKNGRPKILPPADYRPSEDRTQDPHILRAIGRAWAWRRRMEAGEFGTVQELAEAVGLGRATCQSSTAPRLSRAQRVTPPDVRAGLPSSEPYVACVYRRAAMGLP